MATFRVGQRVRIIGACAYPEWIGCEVTILGLPGSEPAFPDAYSFTRPSGDFDPPGRSYSALPHRLAPLTDPKADAFIESIKRLGREPQPETPNVHRERVTNG